MQAGDDLRAHINPEDFVAYHLKRDHLRREEAGVGRSLLMTWIDGTPLFESSV